MTSIRTVIVVAAVLAIAPLASCSSDSSGSDGAAAPSTTEAGSGATGTTGSGDTPTTTEVDRPEGPVADLSEELTGGGGPFSADIVSGIELPDDWTEQEFVAAGTAGTYTAAGDLAEDGTWDLTDDQSAAADYRTRVLVRHPPADAFNGTVVMEWLNVSSGIDADPDYLMAHEELFREGYAWVGISAQQTGVEGGDVAVPVDIDEAGDLAGKGLKGIDAERYGSLEHPGDAYSYDIYTQVGRALRASGSDGPLGGLTTERVLADGESQSAFALTTYANGVQPLTKAFDGFLIHSRGAAGLDLGEPGEPSDIAGAIAKMPTKIRTDLDAPVMIVESETDLFSIIGYFKARQDDTDGIRLWEIAGTAHADARVLGPVADQIDCGVPINDGPQHFVMKAALRSLDTWVRTGEAPPEAPRLDTTETDDKVAAVRNDDGIAEGGIRTPEVDVPAQVLSGAPGPSSEVICLLLGSTKELPADRLAELYPSRDEYLAAYEAATDEAIDAGFVLEDDRQAMLDDAKPDLIES